MPCVNRKHLKKFYEEEAERLSHQELMYLKGNKHNLWWHRKRLKYVFSFLLEILKESQLATFADIGCAEGYYIGRVAAIYSDVRCVGADIARTYVKKAKKSVKRSNVDFTVCDIENLPFKERCFDIVLCSEVLEHVPNHRKAFAELYRIARKYLVISFPGHSYIHKVISKANVLKRLVNNVIPDVGHVSEITVYDIKSLLKTYNYKASTEIKIGGALPLQLYKIIPCVKLVDVIDNMACKILKHFGATDYVTTHVMKMVKEGN